MKKWKERWMALPHAIRVAVSVLLAVILLGGSIYGVLLIIRDRSEAVKVYSAESLCVFASGGNAQSQGRVTTDRVQSVYVTETQEVTEICVREGDRVKKGDTLLTFDTTLTDLELERQDIRVRQLELELENAREQKALLNTYRVFNDQGITSPAEQESAPADGDGELRLRKGSGTKEDPYVYVCGAEQDFPESFFGSLVPAWSGETPPEVFLVLEERENGALRGTLTNSWELKLTRQSDNTLLMRIIPADYRIEEQQPGQLVYDYGSYYSWNDLARLKREAAQKVVDLELELRQARLKLDTLRYELTNGAVISGIDGVVKSVLDPEEARAANKPAVLVSGGGGYYVTGALSEMELDSMEVGDTVNVQSWENYATYEGTITEISRYPDTTGYSYHYSEGNQNVSLYPFTVFLSEDCELRENEYVQLSYSPEYNGTGVYLMSAFVRNENGSFYIWVRDDSGRLEKRSVTTGQNLWGSYTEILSGLDRDEYVAFPYSKSLRNGLPTTVSSLDELYGY